MVNNTTIANFNVTFGKDERPMLDYFDSIIYPAFTSEIVRKYKVTDKESFEYLFLDVQIIKDKEEDYILTGKFVKNYIVEINYVLEDMKLKSQKGRYPSAPYTVFYLFLKNHRIVLIKNQRESPDIRSFSVTIKNILREYIKRENSKRRELGIELLPKAFINILDIPSKGSIEQSINEVLKIRKLILVLFPLNGDIDFTPAFEDSLHTIRELVGSNTGRFILNSPSSKSGVAELLDKTKGLAEPTLEVTYKNGNNGTITNDSMKQSITLNYDEDYINNPDIIIPEVKEWKDIKEVSRGNEEIYNEKKGILKKLFER